MARRDVTRESPLRVLLIAFDSAELSLRLASALAEDAHVTLMLPARDAAPHLKWLAPKVDFRPFEKPRLRQAVRQARLMRRLYRLIGDSAPDVIHFQKGHAWFNLLLLPTLAKRFSVVISIHDPVHHLGDRSSRTTPQWLMNLAYRRAARVIAHNEPMQREISTRCRIPLGRIDVVPLIERGDAAAGRAVPEEDKTILFFGRIWPYKGLEYLIRAEPSITAAVPDARIVIAGQGESFERYRRMMVNPAHFEVHNEFTSVDKRAELFRRASVVVLPYVEATQSGVIPLAYTHAKPVVATAVGGLASQVDDGRTGYLVPPRDSAALAKRVIELLEDGGRRRQFGANGRRKLEREWSASVVAEQTLHVYRRVAGTASSGMRGVA